MFSQVQIKEDGYTVSVLDIDRDGVPRWKPVINYTKSEGRAKRIAEACRELPDRRSCIHIAQKIR